MFITAWNERGNSLPNSQYTTYVYTQKNPRYQKLHAPPPPPGSATGLDGGMRSIEFPSTACQRQVQWVGWTTES